MFAAWVAMGPVNDTPPRVPFVHSLELDRVPRREGSDSLRNVDVVGHQQRLPRWQTQDESLMAAAIIVVRKHLRHGTFAFYLNPASLILECARNRFCRRCRFAGGTMSRVDLVQTDIQHRDDGNDGYEFLHVSRPTWNGYLLGSYCIATAQSRGQRGEHRPD